MRRYFISQNASKIWELLNEVYVMRADNIRYRLEINESDLYTALGWLARDKNIFIMNLNNDLYISNKQHIENYIQFTRT